MRLVAQGVALTAVAVLVALGWHWLGPTDNASVAKSRAKGAGKPTPVLIERVVAADDTIQVRATGTAKALRSATIHSSVAGEVMAVRFKAGQRVSKGDSLVELDAEHQRLSVELANVTVREARRQVKRLERLASSGGASVAGLLTAQSELESAVLNHARAVEALTDRTIRAPFHGVIGLTALAPGYRVTEGTPIATLDDRSSIVIQFNLPEDYAGRIKVGETVQMRPWTMREAFLEGEISALDSRIDPVTRSLRVEARIPNPSDSIRPGTSFEVLKTFVGKPYPVIREVAVIWSRDGAYLWRERDGKAEKVFVRVVRRHKGRILVEGPLTVGDAVVVEGVQGLRIGQAISATPFAAATADR